MEPLAVPKDTGSGPQTKGFQRSSLCFPNFDDKVVIHRGQTGFEEESRKHFSTAESLAAERVVQLKTRLKDPLVADFWATLVESLAEIVGAQMSFVSKRMLVDDENVAVELPPIGEVGSCLMGVVFHFDDGHGIKNTVKDLKYKANDCPCAYMRHDKVFVIPERLNDFITDNPNELPFPGEAYIGVPLFSEGKCFAHFGVCYSPEGAANRKISWTYTEMILHALEDLIAERLVAGQGFAKPSEQDVYVRPTRIVPREAVSASQSLKPYARSLSHELRTPMQGVVGMLDVMHATVQEASEGQMDPRVRHVLKSLRNNIEVVQDSSRRAVEAADNVVHAYDLNMEIPDTPMDGIDESERTDLMLAPMMSQSRVKVLEQEKPRASKIGTKRSRSASTHFLDSPAAKHLALTDTTHVSQKDRPRSVGQHPLHNTVQDCNELVNQPQRVLHDILGDPDNEPRRHSDTPQMTKSSFEEEGTSAPGTRYTRIRELLHYIITESLTVGGRPESAIAVETQLGEKIEVRTKTSGGTIERKTIEWKVDPDVPESFLADERDLAKLISCVFLNAIKFTESGRIDVTASLSPKAKYLSITVVDTGPGIPSDFLPFLFKPFSREDESITRQKDGLGLGLLVAKGLVRKIGGDLVCVRSNTSGPDRGSEFQIRVPLTASDSSSHPGTPFNRTPTPSGQIHSLSLSSSATTPHSDVFSSEPNRGRRRVSNSTEETSSLSSVPTLTTTTGDSAQINSLSPSPAKPTSHSHSHSHSHSISHKAPKHNPRLASTYPLTFLIAEDNKLNRHLLSSMLRKLGYSASQIHEAHDGVEAVRQMKMPRPPGAGIDVVLMDLWMPNMDGYEAARRIFDMETSVGADVDSEGNVTAIGKRTKIMAVSADVTSEAMNYAKEVGMCGFMTKPYKLLDLERLIQECCEEST